MEFKVLDEFTIKGRGTMYVTLNPRQCFNFDWLIGETVILNFNKGSTLQGEVKAVESFAIHTKHEGSPIGILI